MDIKQIEKMLAEIGVNLMKADLDAKVEAKGGVPVADALPVLQCQLFLHIYKKLEAIEQHLQREH